MGEMIKHLIEIHEYKSIGFIRGPQFNPEAELRFEVYKEMLHKYNIEFNQNIIIDGNFFRDSGAEAIHVLFDVRKEKVDVIIAANDSMALGALEAAQKRGINVPKDLAIVGFDDFEESRTSSPLLTTVSRPVYRLGAKAFELLMSLLNNDQINYDELLTTELIIRNSCGCQKDTSDKSKQNHIRDLKESTYSIFNAKKDYFQKEILKLIGKTDNKIDRQLIDRLLDAFSSELEKSIPNSFLPEIESILSETTRMGGDVYLWNEAIYYLRKQLHLNVERGETRCYIESILQQAQIQIGEYSHRIACNDWLEAEKQVDILNDINQSLVATHSIQNIVKILYDQLPKLEITSCFIALHENDVSIKLILGYIDNQRLGLNSENINYRDKNELLTQILEQIPSSCLVIMPLYFQSNILGYIIFQDSKRLGRVYESLRGQISSAIWASYLDTEKQILIDQEKKLRSSLEEYDSKLKLDEVSNNILIALKKNIEYKKASLQLIQGDSRTLLAGNGFDLKKSDPWLNRKVSEDRLVQRIVVSKSPIILPDVELEHDWISHDSTYDVHSWIGIPLLYGQDVIGLLTLDHDQTNFYKQSDYEVLHNFAHDAAINLHKSYIFNITEERIKHLEIINAISQKISSELGIKSLFDALGIHITKSLMCKSCTFFTTTLENEKVVFKSQGGHPESILFSSFNPRESLTSEFFSHGKSFSLNDISDYNMDFHPSLSESNTNSLILVPIKAGNQITGLICVAHDTKEYFDKGLIRILESIANLTAFAIERNSGLELFQETGTNIASLLDRDKIIFEIVNGAVKLTHSSSGVIYLFDEKYNSVIAGFASVGFEHPAPRLELEEGLTRQVITTGSVLQIYDVENDQRVHPKVRENFRSLIAVPLKLKKQVIGVLYLNDISSRHYSGTEVSMLMTLASQAAIAIEKSILIDTAKKRLKDQENTNKILTHLINFRINTHPTESLDDLILLFDEEIRTWPSVKATTILESDEAGNYNFNSCEFINKKNIVDLENRKLVNDKVPFKLANNIYVCPIVKKGSDSTFIIVQTNDESHEFRLHWLQMAQLIVESQFEIGSLIRKAEKLRHAAEEKAAQALVATITRLYNHESLNALKAIGSWIENSKRGTPNLDALEKRVEQLRKSITDLMKATDFTRVRKSYCIINNELDNVLKLLNFQHKKKLDGCEIILNLIGHKHRKVNIDPKTLIHIVNNLVLNAHEQYLANNKKGPITISITEREISNRLFCGFEISDFAKGIEEKDLEDIFQPGWTTKKDGHGLGLWIVEKLVSACEGKIMIESTYGHFTKFIVIYPEIKEDR